MKKGYTSTRRAPVKKRASAVNPMHTSSKMTKTSMAARVAASAAKSQPGCLGDLARQKAWTQEMLTSVTLLPSSKTTGPVVNIPPHLLTDPFKVRKILFFTLAFNVHVVRTLGLASEKLNILYWRKS